ncbi:hypothetical protein [Vibrio furnissii]|uniref:hypothetical protein n=1 Tax=Vibrio furnissii TaxID=29494 RepID=UPI001EE9C75F|nr:hypothetical protein [Vibrio furnissii]MCG6268270.1 hypothetical protein [Vibrio furnissii]
MANSQNPTPSIDIQREIIDLDELLRFLAGSITDDVAMRGFAVALMKAKEMSGRIRGELNS